jgi:hypothetical protein
MKRREFFFAVAGGASAIWPIAASAQQMRRIGVLPRRSASPCHQRCWLKADEVIE